MIRYLSESAVLALYRRHIGPPTLRDPGGFSSAVGRPRSSAFGEDAYPTVILKAAALIQSLAQNQPFIDGNKRIAWIAGNVFLDLKGYELEAGPIEINHLFRVHVAEQRWSIEQIGEWIASYLIRVPSENELKPPKPSE